MTDRPAESWEGLGAADLAARWGAAEVHLFGRLGSTNDVARRLAREGRAAPVVVLAEEQVAGRGRAGRSWVSPPGLGLWFSITGQALAEPGAALLPLRLGLAVARALDEFLPPPGAGIKWPNDLWMGERKLGGILCEATWDGAKPGAVVVGVGLNLLHDPDAFPVDILNGATSVAIQAGEAVSRLAVADRVIPAVRSALQDDRCPDLQALAARDVLRGRQVLVSNPRGGGLIVEGRALGIRSDGALIVLDARGEEHAVRTGSVRPRGAPLC